MDRWRIKTKYTFSVSKKRTRLMEKNITRRRARRKFSFLKLLAIINGRRLIFILLILIFIFVSLISENFFSGRTLVSFLIFLGFIILMGVARPIRCRTKKCVHWYFCLNRFIYYWCTHNTRIPFST